MKNRALGLISQDSLVAQGWQLKTTNKNVMSRKAVVLDVKKKSINSEHCDGIFMSTFREMDTLNTQFIWISGHLQYHFEKWLKTITQDNPFSLCADADMSARKIKLCFWARMWEPNWKDFTDSSSLHSLIQSQEKPNQRPSSTNYPHRSWKALHKIPHPQRNDGAAEKPLKQLLPKKRCAGGHTYLLLQNQRQATTEQCQASRQSPSRTCFPQEMWMGLLGAAQSGSRKEVRLSQLRVPTSRP